MYGGHEVVGMAGGNQPLRMWISGILDGDERALACRPGSKHEVGARVDVPSLMLHLSGGESGHGADHLEREASPASANNLIVDADQGTRDYEENEKSRGEGTTHQRSQTRPIGAPVGHPHKRRQTKRHEDDYGGGPQSLAVDA